jgi:hypothetical protein
MNLEQLKKKQMELAKQLDNCEFKDFTLIMSQCLQITKDIYDEQIRLEGLKQHSE